MSNAKKLSDQEFVYNFYRYKTEEKNIFKNEKEKFFSRIFEIKTFKQILDFLNIKQNRKIQVLPKYFSIEQDRQLRVLTKKFKEKPFKNFWALIKTFSLFFIQNNSFLLKTFIKINDSIFLELLKIFNFYTALSFQAMIKTYFAVYIEPYFVVAKHVKISSKYYYDEVRSRWK